jgi:hypothetical protein
MGLGPAAGFARYHHVLRQACWSSRAVASKLLAMILEAFLPNGRLRWGQKIAARSTHGHFVKANGLRWLSLMVMVPIPFVRRR